MRLEMVLYLTMVMAVVALNGCATMEAKPTQAASGEFEYPKLGVYWTSPTMSEDEARQNAKFQLVVADMENLVNNRASLELLKRLNPSVKLLAYSNPMELFVPMTANRPLQSRLLELAQNQYSAWWLKQPNGQPVIFWQGMQMLNLSLVCPLVNGLRWNQFVAKFLLQNVLADKIWDGYFMDNSGGNISWVNGGQIDADVDGARDIPEKLDQAWLEGIREFLSTIRQAKGKNFILVGNKGSAEFLDILDGKMFEEFPNDYLGDKEAGGWYQSLANYYQTGPYSIIQAKANGDGWRQFVLASALLGDGYFIYAQDENNWYDDYRGIGRPTNGVEKLADGSWRREYDKAIAVVWPEKQEGKIIYR